MKAPRLSVLVVAHNEAAQLADCLKNLGFADELVVVLDKFSIHRKFLHIIHFFKEVLMEK